MFGCWIFKLVEIQQVFYASLYWERYEMNALRAFLPMFRHWGRSGIPYRIQARQDFSPKTWPIFFAIVIWWLWRWRNCVTFNNTKISFDVLSFLTSRFEEAWRVLGGSIVTGINGNSSRQEIHVQIRVRWQAPPVGVDGPKY